MMGAVGSICAVVFGLIWTAMASQISLVFSLFGVVFVILGIVQFIYNLHNARSDNRFSEFEITEDGEEHDPLDRKHGMSSTSTPREGAVHYCPYCGKELKEDYNYCPQCGRKLE